MIRLRWRRSSPHPVRFSAAAVAHARKQCGGSASRRGKTKVPLRMRQLWRTRKPREIPKCFCRRPAASKIPNAADAVVIDDAGVVLERRAKASMKWRTPTGEYAGVVVVADDDVVVVVAGKVRGRRLPGEMRRAWPRGRSAESMLKFRYCCYYCCCYCCWRS